MNLGIVQFYKQEYEKAYLYYNEAMDIFEQIKEKIEVLRGCFNLSEVCDKLGRHEEALEWYSKGMKAFKKEDHPQLYQLFQGLGETLEGKK